MLFGAIHHQQQILFLKEAGLSHHKRYNVSIQSALILRAQLSAGKTVPTRLGSPSGSEYLNEIRLLIIQKTAGSTVKFYI